jgi:hypothetical protein
MEAPAAVPGAWGFGLKPLAKALARLDARYDPKWVGDLCDSNDGAARRCVGMADVPALRQEKNQAAEGFSIWRTTWQPIRAVWQVLRWLRAPAAPQAHPCPSQGGDEPDGPGKPGHACLSVATQPSTRARHSVIPQPQPGKKVGKELSTI